MNSCKNKKEFERGNVLFFILIGVALFGALTAAINYSGQGGNAGVVIEEKASIYASEVMEFAERVSSAISKLRLRGCGLSQISFEAAQNTGYVNGAAPGDESCHIFSVRGGALGWANFSNDMFNQAWSAEADFGAPIFTIKNEIPQVGTDGDGANSYELLMLVEGLNGAVCDAMNQRIFGNMTVNNAAEVETKFDGIINTTGTYTFPAAFNGMRQACYNDNGGADAGTLSYYYAVVIR